MDMKSTDMTPVNELFRRWPALLGFTVLDADSLADEDDGIRLEGGLALADVDLHRWTSPAHELEIVSGVAEALQELIAESPQAEQLLRGHTFARTLH